MGKLNKVKSSDKKHTLNSKHNLRAVFIALFWLAIWEAASLLVSNSLLLPSPTDTLSSLISLCKTGSFYVNILSTVLRVIAGVIISFTLGYAAAGISYRHQAVRDILRLPVSFFKSVPVMAVIIYLILLMSANSVVIFVCFFMCFPIAYTNILSGLDNISKEYTELGIAFNLTEKEIAKYILRPGIMPNIKSALNLMCGMSWKVVIASEILAIPAHSLGYQMMNAKYYLETPTLFSYILVIVLLALAMEKIMKSVLLRYQWKPYKESRIYIRKVEFNQSVENSVSNTGIFSKSKEAGESKASEESAESEEPAESRESEESPKTETSNKSPESEISDESAESTESEKSEESDESGESDESADSAEPKDRNFLKDTSNYDLSSKSDDINSNILFKNIGLKNVSKSFGEKEILKDFSLMLEKGKVVTLFAPSGSGKTTVGRMLMGFEIPESGEILKPDSYSCLFQEDRLLPWLNVYDNLALAIRSSTKDSLNSVIRNMADALEISDVLYELPGSLSGGMQHRVSLGRAFLKKSELLILDEPFRGLDEALQDRIIDRLWKKETSGRYVLLITHDRDLKDRLSDTIITL